MRAECHRSGQVTEQLSTHYPLIFVHREADIVQVYGVSTTQQI